MGPLVTAGIVIRSGASCGDHAPELIPKLLSEDGIRGNRVQIRSQEFEQLGFVDPRRERPFEGQRSVTRNPRLESRTVSVRPRGGVLVPRTKRPLGKGQDLGTPCPTPFLTCCRSTGSAQSSPRRRMSERRIRGGGQHRRIRQTRRRLISLSWLKPVQNPLPNSSTPQPRSPPLSRFRIAARAAPHSVPWRKEVA